MRDEQALRDPVQAAVLWRPAGEAGNSQCRHASQCGFATQGSRQRSPEFRAPPAAFPASRLGLFVKESRPLRPEGILQRQELAEHALCLCKEGNCIPGGNVPARSVADLVLQEPCANDENLCALQPK
jgi:hypothetical protein